MLWKEAFLSTESPVYTLRSFQVSHVIDVENAYCCNTFSKPIPLTFTFLELLLEENTWNKVHIALRKTFIFRRNEISQSL
ncbi:Hypothetical predicted protein [Podarcis lilfordi]|uniref:Uncharacterized protein n=1 Tax=Podarcis lilfordi TaxID=74358 RepID=A0AA35K4Z2_9SAUR|nr:Hypothetical predicted protein [Podarcis lilfordi]